MSGLSLISREFYLTAMSVKRANWLQPLPRPVVVTEVMNLVTLADVRTLIERHLPAHCRSKATWRHVGALLSSAATGRVSTGDVEIALRILLSIDGIECRPR